MIVMSCPHCGHTLRIDDRFAGRSGTCFYCHARIAVPVHVPDAASQAPAAADHGAAAQNTDQPQALQVLGGPSRPINPLLWILAVIVPPAALVWGLCLSRGTRRKAIAVGLAAVLTLAEAGAATSIALLVASDSALLDRFREQRIYITPELATYHTTQCSAVPEGAKRYRISGALAKGYRPCPQCQAATPATGPAPVIASIGPETMPSAAPTGAASAPEVAPAAATAPGGLEHFEDKGMGIALDYPKGWFVTNKYEKTGLIPGMSVASRPPRDQSLSFRFSTSANPGSQSEQFDPEAAMFGVTFVGASAPNVRPEDYFNPAAMDQYKDHFYKGEIVQQPASSTVAGKEVVSAVFRGENAAGVSLTFSVFQIAAQGCQALATSCYPTAREAEFGPQLDAILRSVTLSPRTAERAPQAASPSADPTRQRPADAGPAPKLTVEITGALDPGDITIARWQMAVMTPGPDTLSLRFTAAKVAVARGGGMTESFTLPMNEPFTLAPNRPYVLGSARRGADMAQVPEALRGMMQGMGDMFGTTRIEPQQLAQTGTMQLALSGTLYFEDGNGQPFSVPFEKTLALQAAAPGGKMRKATCPRIASMRFRVVRPPRLAVNEVRELDAFLDITVDNPNPAPVTLQDARLPSLEQVGLSVWFRESPPGSTDKTTTFKFWVTDSATITNLLSGKVTRIPVSGRITLLIKEPGWSPATFAIDVETAIPLQGETGATQTIAQKEASPAAPPPGFGGDARGVLPSGGNRRRPVQGPTS